jgi:hypothetical protein
MAGIDMLYLGLVQVAMFGFAAALTPTTSAKG